MAHLRTRLIVAAAALALALPATAAAAPIPQGPSTAGIPAYEGAPAAPDGFYAADPPRHPFMAANGSSEIHDDAYQTDTYQGTGPLGVRPQVISTQLNADCGSVTFDRQGRIVTVCVGLAGPTLYMLDPHTLATLASMSLPPRQSVPTNPFQDFTGGGYFYLDNQDRVVVGTTTRHLYVIAEAPGPGFTLQHDYDLSTTLAQGDKITSALPDWSGRIWVESLGGTLVTIDPATGATRSLALGEETENSFAVDETRGVYVVSTAALYRLDAAPDGTPRVTWRVPYPNSGIHKPGQVDAGSGTTPTVQGPYVTITDNADPLDIVVYRRAATLPAGLARQVCVQPIFAKGAGSDENSIIGAGNTMVAENNYGYTGPAAVENGGRTSPGIVRVDIAADGRSCHVVWHNDTERVPTVVSKLSLAAGLIYSYTKDDPSSSDPWFFTAIDFRTGRVVYRVLTGSGLGFNNNYAPVTLSADGTAYVGVIGGLVAIRDAVAPHVAPARAPGSPGRRPGMRRHGGPRLVIVHRRGRSIGVLVLGAPRGTLRVRYAMGDERATSRRRPYQATLAPEREDRGRRLKLCATLVVAHGRRSRGLARLCTMVVLNRAHHPATERR